MNAPKMPEGVYQNAAIETSDRRAFLSKTLGITAGLVGAAVTAGAYAVPAFAQKSKLQAAQRADFLVHFGNFFCLKSQESTDECWLKFDGITLYQGPMRAGPAWTQFLQNGPTRAQALNKPVAIVWLLEEDGGLGDPDDRLGSHTIRQDEAGQGWKQCRFTLDGAHYGLDYHVERAGT